MAELAGDQTPAARGEGLLGAKPMQSGRLPPGSGAVVAIRGLAGGDPTALPEGTHFMALLAVFDGLQGLPGMDVQPTRGVNPAGPTASGEGGALGGRA